jgi:hypothetical protein
VSICVALILASLGLVFIFRPSLPVPAVVMPLPDGIPAQKPNLLERSIPPTWGWAWCLKELVFGRIKPITLKTALIDFGGSSNSLSPLFLLREPQFANTNGLQVWILNEAELDAVSRGLLQTPGNEILAQPRIVTADGIDCNIYVGTTLSIDGTQRAVGLNADFLPRLRRDSTDLFVVITHTAAVTNQATATTGLPIARSISVRTNVAVAARIQIPKGSGAFLLNDNRGVTNGGRVAVMISATYK